MEKKICIIGAGSAVFSLNLIKDICLTPGLRNSIICFMDIDEVRLDSVFKLCKRYSEELGINLILQKTTDRREALKGSDFIINTALAAEHDRLREGWGIAKKNGYKFGGSLHIIHDEAFWINFYQLKLMEDILKDMLEICPRAWYIMVANPVMAGVTYLKRKYPQANIVGMCHGYAGVYGLINALGIVREEVTFEVPGVNHFVWLTEFRYKGKDAFPLIDKWISEIESGKITLNHKSSGEGLKAIDLYKRFGAYPIGDTCTPGGGSWGYWYHTDEVTQKRWNEDPEKWYADYFESIKNNVKNIHDVANNPNIKVSEIFSSKHSEEPMIPLIEALACDVERIVIVNIMNDGNFVQGVPMNFEVEVPALVSGKGIQGIRTNGLPKPLTSYLLRDRYSSVEMELQAFEYGSKEMLKNLIMMDPWTKSEEQAENLLTQILNLPYHFEMREHYK